MHTLIKTAKIIKRLVKREYNYHRIQPTTILFFLTYRCTSRCNCCVMWQRKADVEKELSLDECKKLIDMAVVCGVHNLELFGGDALLRKDVAFPLSTYARNKGIPNIDLVTNCNLIDDETARQIAECGITYVYVSLDGIGPTHDRIRGVPGSFEKVKNGIQLMLKNRNGKTAPKICINSTISNLNVNDFEKILPFAEDIGVDSVSFEYVGEVPPREVPCSKINGITPEPYFISQNNSSLLLNREQAVLLKNKIKEIKSLKAGKKIEINTKNIDILSIDELTEGVFDNRQCYICRYMVPIDPYGNVLPCAIYRDYVLGNIKTTHLKKIWRNKEHKKFLKQVGNKKTPICKYCVMGVERNPNFFKAVKKSYFNLTKKGIDE